MTSQLLGSPFESTTVYEARVVGSGSQPNIVLVDMKRTAGMNPQRAAGRGHTLMDEFVGRNAEGKPWMYRFEDANGNVIAPRLPATVDISTEHGKKQLKVFRAYKLFYEPRIVIHNPLEMARAEVVSDDLMLDAMVRLKELRQAGDEETLSNLLRRIEGGIGSKTLDMVVAALHRIAKTDPAAILKLDADPAFQQKVLVDKAVEAKRLVIKNSYYYYYPEGVYEGRLIAEGLDKMLLAMRQNTELESYILSAAEALRTGSLPGSVAAAGPQLSAEDRAALAEIDDAGSAADLETTDETGGYDPDLTSAMSEEQTRDIIRQAIAMNHFESDGNGRVKLPDGQYRTPGEVEAHYLINGRQATALREELRVAGLIN